MCIEKTRKSAKYFFVLGKVKVLEMIPCKVQPYAQSARKMPRGMKGRHAVDMV